MSPELLRRILEKAMNECTVTYIYLYTWGEPLLHQQIHELIRIVNGKDIRCGISSNLNILPDADAIMAANPTEFRISLSGFTQEVYGITHRGGDIERVKGNMIKLADARKRHKASTRISVYYHRYLHNLHEEAQMHQFSSDLGFEFETTWAIVLQLEKIVSMLDGDNSRYPLTTEDNELISRLALPLTEALRAAQLDSNRPCVLREEQITIDFKGDVKLCCGVFDPERFTLGNFLEIPLDEIQRLRSHHKFCERCLHHSAHNYLTLRIPEIEKLVKSHIKTEGAEYLNLDYGIAKNRLHRHLLQLYSAFSAGLFTKR
jgi:MoaA/NifB/PqqE/SkfB family radical SAM enzyme